MQLHNLPRYTIRILGSFVIDAYYFFVATLKVRAQKWQYYAASKKYPDFLKFGQASHNIEAFALQYCKGDGVDLGAGHSPLPGAKAIDLAYGNGAEQIPADSNSLDFVFSSHMMEHVDNVTVVLKEIFRVLKPGGVLFLYLPHPVNQMWSPQNFEYHKRSLDPKKTADEIIKEGFSISQMTFTPDTYFSFFILANKLK